MIDPEFLKVDPATEYLAGFGELVRVAIERDDDKATAQAVRGLATASVDAGFTKSVQGTLPYGDVTEVSARRSRLRNEPLEGLSPGCHTGLVDTLLLAMTALRQRPSGEVVTAFVLGSRPNWQGFEQTREELRTGQYQIPRVWTKRLIEELPVSGPALGSFDVSPTARSLLGLTSSATRRRVITVRDLRVRALLSGDRLATVLEELAALGWFSANPTPAERVLACTKAEAKRVAGWIGVQPSSSTIAAAAQAAAEADPDAVVEALQNCAPSRLSNRFVRIGRQEWQDVECWWCDFASLYASTIEDEERAWSRLIPFPRPPVAGEAAVWYRALVPISSSLTKMTLAKVTQDPPTLQLLSVDGDPLVRRVVASNPWTDREVVAALTTDLDRATRRAALHNRGPELEPEPEPEPGLDLELALLAEDRSNDAKEGEVPSEADLGEQVVEPPMGDGDSHTNLMFQRPRIRAVDRRIRSTTECSSPNRLAELAGDSSPAVRMAVVANPNTPTATMRAFVNDPNVDVRAALARIASDDVLRDLADDPNTGVRLEVAMNERTPVEVLDRFASSEDASERGAAAANASLTPERRRALGCDSHLLVREAARLACLHLDDVLDLPSSALVDPTGYLPSSPEKAMREIALTVVPVMARRLGLCASTDWDRFLHVVSTTRSLREASELFGEGRSSAGGEPKP